MTSNDKTTSKNYNTVFDKIDKEKRERILDIVLTEFAANGYSATNINTIAQKANISIGSLYRYFGSKENLFLSIVDVLYSVVEKGMQKIIAADISFFDKLEVLFRDSQRSSDFLKKLNHIYLDLSTEGLAELSKKISTKMEEISAFTYRALINDARESGIINTDIETNYLSFFIDNMLVMFHFSYTTEYHSERKKIFLREDTDQDEKLLQAQIKFLKAALSYNE